MITIFPSKISGEISLPPSKSQTLRALFFSFFSKKSIIENYLHSPDVFNMIDILKNFGIKIEIFKNRLLTQGTKSQGIKFQRTKVQGILYPKKNIIDVKNSGIALRFITCALALYDKKIKITGDDSIKKNRVVSPLIKGLRDLKVKVISENGHPPLTIKGPMSSGKIFINGEDSQPVSAFLITCSFLKGPTEIFVKNPGEKPWIDLTLDWLDFFNIPYIFEGYKYYKVYGNASLESFEKKIESDFTSMYYPIALALITNSNIKINIDVNKKGPDRKLLDILIDMGANIEIKKDSIIIKKSKLIGRNIDVNDMIDTLPILAVIGCFAKGRTVLYNGSIARKKESDRIEAISKELKKMGADIETKEDGLVIKESSLKGVFLKESFLSSHNDHRIALSLTVAALAAKGKSVIKDCFCISKSYPDFFEDLKKMGAKIL